MLLFKDHEGKERRRTIKSEQRHQLLRRIADVKILLPLFVLAGCAAPKTQPKHLDPAQIGSPAPRVYLEIHPAEEADLLTRLFDALTHQRSYPVLWRPLLRELTTLWTKEGITVVANRVSAQSDSNDAYPLELQPTLVIVLDIDSFAVEKEAPDSITQQPSFECRMTYKVRVLTYPDHRLIQEAGGELSTPTSGMPDDPEDLRFETAALADQLSGNIFPDHLFIPGPAPIAASVETPWFTLKTAVLPLDNETNSLDGAVLVRRAAQDYLQKGGYAVMPLEDVDQKLRALGYTDGGQLRHADLTRLAEALKADLLFSGVLQSFDRTPVSRKISGEMHLWDRELKQETWSGAQTVQNVNFRPGKSGAFLLAQIVLNLTAAFIEQAAGQPLGQETVLFVDRTLRGLPMRPETCATMPRT